MPSENMSLNMLQFELICISGAEIDKQILFLVSADIW